MRGTKIPQGENDISSGTIGTLCYTEYLDLLELFNLIQTVITKYFNKSSFKIYIFLSLYDIIKQPVLQ